MTDLQEEILDYLDEMHSNGTLSYNDYLWLYSAISDLEVIAYDD